MMTTATYRKPLTIAVVAGAALLLAACFLLPGKFVSTLDVRRDGHFTFAYKGELVVFNPANVNDAVKGANAGPENCFGPLPGGDPQPPAAAKPNVTMHVCTPAEVAKRKAEADANRKREGEQFGKLFGLDPNDQLSMQAYAALLQKQAGWRSVSYRGNGVFDVDFEQSGTLDRDLVFPLLPKSPYIGPFVVIRKRADGAVLVSAPGFSANPLSAFTKALGGMNNSPGRSSLPAGPQGSFTITTDTAPLTNNTEDGPTRDGSRTVLRWTVGAASDKIPEALLPITPMGSGSRN